MAQRVAHAGRRGLTIIELMVVLVIIALVTGLIGFGIGAIRSVDVDTSASVLAGALRFTSSLAVQENKTYRLIIDMDEGAFWAELADSEDPCARYAPDSADLSAEEAIAAQRDEDDETPTLSFTREELDLLNRALEPDTNVTGVVTELHDAVQDRGRAAIYFYPNGYAQRSMLWIGGYEGDEGGEAIYAPQLTLEVHNLGRVTRHNEVLSADDFLRDLP